MSKTNNTTKQIIDFLNKTGRWKVWRNNNLAVKGRSFIGLKGVPDIIGFCLMGGEMIAIEVKTDDELSEEQYQFLVLLHCSGGFAYVAKSFDHFKNQFDSSPDNYKQFLPKKLRDEKN